MLPLTGFFFLEAFFSSTYFLLHFLGFFRKTASETIASFLILLAVELDLFEAEWDLFEEVVGLDLFEEVY